jgi:HAMP domain-containing protein
MAPEAPAHARPGWSVRVRILASILVTAALGLVVAGLVSYELQRAATLRDVDARLTTELTEARRVVDAQSDVTSTRAAVRQVLSVAVPPEDGGTIGLVDGSVAFTPGVTEPVHPEKLVGFAARISEETADGSVRRGTFTAEGRSYRYLAVPVSVAGDPARGVFAVAIDLGRRLEPVDGTFRVYALIASGVVVVIAVIGWMIAGRLLAPIRRLNTMAQRIGADDLRERIPVAGDDDISVLTGTVNSMLDRIETGVRQRRALLDDVRHELKAPLSVVRGELELLDSHDPREVAEARLEASEARLVVADPAVEPREVVRVEDRLRVVRLRRRVGHGAPPTPSSRRGTSRCAR